MFLATASVFRCAQVAFGFGLFLAISAPAFAVINTTSVGGTESQNSIGPAFETFLGALGAANNGNGPGTIGGRREINWDGGGATMASPVPTPFTGFQNTRGATFTTPGTGFLQTPLTDAALTGLQASYATSFLAFTPQRIFTPLGSNITDVTFSVPGSGGATQATVSGFGAVFSDVDLAATTTLELFDLGGISQGVFNVLPGSGVNSSFSFLGVMGDAGERIARVRITTGNSALGPVDQNGDTTDVVVMDDFIYSEPVAVPEPTSALLLIVGMVGGAFMRRSRRRRGSPRP